MSEIPGWFNFSVLYEEIVDNFQGEKGYFAEVGVFAGLSVIYLAEKVRNSRKDISVFAIDTFQGTQSCQFHLDYIKANKGDLLWLFWKHVRERGLDKIIIPIRANSQYAAKVVHKSVSFDMVFLEYPEIYGDLKAWWPRIAKNGCLDFRANSPVKSAVKQFSRDYNLTVLDKSLSGEAFMIIKL